MTRTAQSPIVVCGHLCLDIIPGFPPAGPQEWFRPGRLSMVEAATIATGGAVSNVGLSLHTLGFPVRLVAAIGDDPLGGLVRERVRGLGADLPAGLTVLKGGSTSYTVVLSPPGVDRIFLHCPGVNDSFGGDELEEGSFRGAGIFHFGYPPLMRQFWCDGGKRLARLLTRARAAGALTSLDMSLPDPASPSGKADWPGILEKALPCVDIFAPSIEELLFMMDRPSFDRLSRTGGGESIVRGITFRELAALSSAILAQGVSAVLIKLGDRGAYLRTGPKGLGGLPLWAGREIYSPCFSVPSVVGTTGSGDATIAGFLGAIQKGLDPTSALRMAVAVGACCVEAPDATSGIRTWGETVSRVSAGWQRVESAPREPGWTRTDGGAWKGPADP